MVIIMTKMMSQICMAHPKTHTEAICPMPLKQLLKKQKQNKNPPVQREKRVSVSLETSRSFCVSEEVGLQGLSEGHPTALQWERQTIKNFGRSVWEGPSLLVNCPSSNSPTPPRTTELTLRANKPEGAPELSSTFKNSPLVWWVFLDCRVLGKRKGIVRSYPQLHWLKFTCRREREGCAPVT